MGFAAKILADSIGPNGQRLTTIEVTFPRFILAEFNTHRMLSRNSASSRAIPVEKRITAIEFDPFIPEVFGKNQKGMQASEVLGGVEGAQSRERWIMAMEDAVRHARVLATLGVHKQLANRVIEPYCWHTCIASATEWDNFWALRCHPDAQPEIRKAAEMMREVYNASTPANLPLGAWHLPLLPDRAELEKTFTLVQLCQISIGRCARVSYLTHDGRRDPNADIELFQRLASSGHMSPLEHVAETSGDRSEWSGNFRGWKQFRKTILYEDNFGEVLKRRVVS